MALVKGTNSYVEVADANAYFLDRIGSESWVAAGSTIQAQALITATRLLDELSWIGTATSETQTLAFPRAGVYFEPRQGLEVVLDDADTPDRIVSSTYELALHLIQNEGLLESTGGVSDINVGSIKLSNIKTAPVIPAAVKRIYKPLLLNQGVNSWWRAN